MVRKKVLDASQAGQDAMKRRTHAPCKQRWYALITIAALTGEISATHLYHPPSHLYQGSTSGISGLERALVDLADGGYVIDLRPLADHPQVDSWVMHAPMPSGRIAGDDIARLCDATRQFAMEMGDAFQGNFQSVAFLMANRFGEPLDGSAGPFDYVSSAYLVVYWGSRGGRIGKREGSLLLWSNGEQCPIPSAPQENA